MFDYITARVLLEGMMSIEILSSVGGRMTASWIGGGEAFEGKIIIRTSTSLFSQRLSGENLVVSRIVRARPMIQKYGKPRGLEESTA